MAEKNNSIQTIERDIVSYTNDRVTMTQTFGYKGIIWIVLGVLIFFTQFFDKENGAWTMAALILGMSLGIYGLIVFLARKPQYVYEGKKSMKIREFMFDGDRYNDVEKLYEAGDFSGMLDIPHNAANKMMLKILYATDYSIAYSQLYKFSSETYNFEPQREIRIHKDAECQKINTLVISY